MEKKTYEAPWIEVFQLHGKPLLLEVAFSATIPEDVLEGEDIFEEYLP